MKKIIGLIFLLLLVGCTNSTPKTNEEVSNDKDNKFDKLVIKTEITNKEEKKIHI